MFDLLRFVCELIFGSSLSLSREIFDYLSTKLHTILIQLLQQSFSIALRSKRTRLLGDDLQLILKCRNISPLYGYCCLSTTDKIPSFQTVRQDARTYFIQTDLSINLTEHHLSTKNVSYRVGRTSKECLISSGEIILHVEWLAIGGEQKHHPRMKSSLSNKLILNIEQQLYLLLIQSQNFNEEIWRFLYDDQIALNTILSPLIEWCRINICECLVHSCRLQKRRQLVYYLTIIDCLLQNSSTMIDQYLYILSPMVTSCLLYEFESHESLEFDENTGDIWSIRLLAARTCVKILQRSNSFVYDVFYTRIISRLVHSLIDSITPPSMIYAILCLFEQLGVHVSRTFLLPHLSDLNLSKILSSKSIVQVLERIALMLCNK